MAGTRCCAGNPDWLASHEPAAASAPAVERLLAAGATLTGRARCDELTYSVSGRNAHYGTPANPSAPGCLPGGSSSGSASAVAGGLADFALGTDTTGSIRVPAALCGIWGLRPTHGAVPTEAVVPLAPTYDTVGLLARDGDVLAAATAALLDPGRARPVGFTRVIVPADAWSVADPGVRAKLAPAAERIGPGLDAEELDIAPEGLPHWAGCVRVEQAAEVWQQHGQWVLERRPSFGADVAERMQAAREIDAVTAAEATAFRLTYGRRIRELVGDDGVLLIPTCPTTAPIATAPARALDDWRGRVMQLTSIANLSGLPQLAVPCGEVGGRPVSLSLIGPPGSELALIELAGAAAAGAG